MSSRRWQGEMMLTKDESKFITMQENVCVTQMYYNATYFTRLAHECVLCCDSRRAAQAREQKVRKNICANFHWKNKRHLS